MAKRLKEVIPASLELRVKDEAINAYDIRGVDFGGSAAADIVDEDDDRPFPEKVGTAAWQILNGVQDAVTEHLRKPWPPFPGPARMASPNVRIEGTRVFLWYGDDEASAVITLPPFDFAELDVPPYA